MSLEKFDSLRRTVYNMGKTRVQVTCNLATAAANDKRRIMESVTLNSTDNTRFSDCGTLNRLFVQTSDYITFNYYNKDSADPSESVWISYPNMFDFYDFLDNVLNMVNTESLYTRKGINSKYKDISVTSAEFVSGKQLMAVPSIIQYNNSVEVLPAIDLYIANENQIETITVNTFYGLYYRLKNLNLGQEIDNLITMALIIEGQGIESHSSTNVVSGNAIPSRPNRSIGNGFGKSNNKFNNKSSNFTSTKVKHTTLDEMDDEVNTEEDDDLPFKEREEDEENKASSQKFVKNNKSKKVSSSKKVDESEDEMDDETPISLSSIKKRAKKIDLPEEDEELYEEV